MIVTSERLIQSLVDIVTTNDTDAYLLDTNVVGVDFFNNGRGNISLFSPRLAKKNNIQKRAVRKHAEDVAMFLEMIKTYESLETTQQTIEETAEKNRLLSDASVLYGERGRHRERHGQRRSHHQDKASKKIESEKAMLKEIVKKESAILEILKTRVYVPEAKKVLPFEELAVIAYHDTHRNDAANQSEKKNYNDEKIVAAAVYRAVVEDRGVVIVSRDKGIGGVVKQIIRQVHADNCDAPLFLKAVKEAKVNIAHDITNDWLYKITYSSFDYKKYNPSFISPETKQVIEKCEAVIRQARTSPASLPEQQQPAQILYTSTA